MSYSSTIWRRRRNEKRARLILYLMAHPCVDCGETDLRVLDFDHEDPKTKTGNVGRLMGGGNRSWKSVEAEIRKCKVRCASCHRKKTIGTPRWFRNPHGFVRQALGAAERAAASRGRKHGTHSMYSVGCRCNPCREAHRTHCRNDMRRRRARSSAE